MDPVMIKAIQNVIIRHILATLSYLLASSLIKTDDRTGGRGGGGTPRKFGGFPNLLPFLRPKSAIFPIYDLTTNSKPSL